MCGLAGLLVPDVSRVPERVKHVMREAVAFRGRDDSGEWSDGHHVQLFHSRLSIIDLASGHQPMLDTDGRLTIVFTGEIYNYVELRERYQALGATFHTKSDTEVILQGFKLRGSDVCQELNGMFAFAVWDSHDRTIFLARDQLGKKPLFWCVVGGVFAFASTMHAFEGLEGWSGELSPSGLVLYSLLSNFPEDATVYRQARRFPYASWARVSPGQTELWPVRYWRMAFDRKLAISQADALDEYEALLTDATRIRLRSDVPIALTFSGGVDSGTIAAVAARKLNTSLRCYTIDYDAPDDRSSETANAKAVAGLLGLDWQYIHFDYRTRLLSDLSDTYRYYDEPCQNMGLPYSQRLYEAVRPHATVVLAGNGADELFTGYVGDERMRREDLALNALRWLRPAFRAAHRLSGRRSQLVARLQSPYLRLSLPDAWVETMSKAATALGWAADDEVGERIRAIGREMSACGVSSRMDLSMFLSLTCTSADSNYRLPDISGLAAQVEVRSPYLDTRLVEFAARLPHRLKVANPVSPGGNKHLPKAYYERYVPRELARGPKRGMGFNMRWDRSTHDDPTFRERFAAAYDRVEQAGIDAAPYRRAWREYLDRPLVTVGGSPYAPLMVNGFMLGEWLALARRASRAGA